MKGQSGSVVGVSIGGGKSWAIVNLLKKLKLLSLAGDKFNKFNFFTMVSVSGLTNTVSDGLPAKPVLSRSTRI